MPQARKRLARLILSLIAALGVLCIAICGAALAEEPAPNLPSRMPNWPVIRASFLVDPPNVVAPTRGGTQLWGDVVLCGQWRIQRYVVTGHCRLLDPDDVRHAWGSQASCQAHLDDLKRRGVVEPVRGTVVLVLHGLIGSRQQMSPLVEALAEEHSWTVLSVGYPSTRASVADHAAALRSIMANLDGAKQIHFVAHSLGNLVVRHYLSDHSAAHDGRHDPRLGRIVMLGPPNHGSRVADKLGGNVVFDTTLGESAQQLAHRWRELEPHLATPPCEFAIIAGGKGNQSGFNPLLDGDDDGTVRVAETRLAGASDFVLVDALHSFLMSNKSVQEQTRRYLLTGSFRADGTREPITERGEEPQ